MSTPTPPPAGSRFPFALGPGNAGTSTPGTIGVPSLWPLTQSLVDCLCTNLTHTLSGAPARCCVMPGAVVVDDCCAGTAWVRIDEVITTDPDYFPATLRRIALAGQCGEYLMAVTFGLGVMRCAHSLVEDGTPPDCDQLTDDALKLQSDLDALYRTAYCCLPDDYVQETYLGQYTPVGPEGGCVGGELAVTYAIPLCPCEDDDPAVAEPSFGPLRPSGGR